MHGKAGSGGTWRTPSGGTKKALPTGLHPCLATQAKHASLAFSQTRLHSHCHLVFTCRMGLPRPKRTSSTAALKLYMHPAFTAHYCAPTAPAHSYPSLPCQQFLACAHFSTRTFLPPDAFPCRATPSRHARGVWPRARGMPGSHAHHTVGNRHGR